MNRLVFFGGVEYNLSDKIEEVFDSLHSESSLIRNKYKGVISGIVIDEKKLKHVRDALMRMFVAEDFSELIATLNKLNESKAPCTHIKFFFDKFKLDEHLMKAVDDYSERHGLKKLDSTYDSLWAIANNDTDLKCDVREFVKSIHLSRFVPAAPRFAGLSAYKKISEQPEMSEVMSALERLETLQQILLPEIKKNFNQMNILAEKIILR